MTKELANEVIDRLVDLPIGSQADALRNAKIIMENWSEISECLTRAAIEKECYEVCAILRDL